MEINKEALVAKMAVSLPILRAKRGLTQEQLAQLLDVSRHTVLLIENQKRPMTWSTFLALTLLFISDDESMALLKALDLYTESLEAYLKK